MNWIARYVAQVKSYLPEENRDDVAEEINSLLEEKFSDRGEALGRDLNEEEVFALLREFGPPLKVASAYRDSGPLISETLFPLYMLVIRYMVVILVAIWAVSLVMYFITGERDAWPNVELSDLFDMGLFYFGAITLGFHLTDRYLTNANYLANWDPAQLPRHDAERESLFTIVLTVFFMLAWFIVLSQVNVVHSFDELMGASNNRFTTFILWLKIQVILCLPAYIWLMFRPYWSVGKRLLIIFCDLAIIVGAVICLQIDGVLFEARMAEVMPWWESSLGLATASTILITLWGVGAGWDLISNAFKIRRELKSSH
ncbi:MAG: hypothetical protein WD772_11075 [Pseudohongiellaceae bacterium]